MVGKENGCGVDPRVLSNGVGRGHLQRFFVKWLGAGCGSERFGAKCDALCVLHVCFAVCAAIVLQGPV